MMFFVTESMLTEELEAAEKEIAALAVKRKNTRRGIEALEADMKKLRDMISAVSAMTPPSQWEPGEVENIPEELGGLLAEHPMVELSDLFDLQGIRALLLLPYAGVVIRR